MTESFNNTTVLMSGGTGFIGQRVLRALVEHGARVANLTHKSNIDKSGFSAAEQARIIDSVDNQHFDYVVNLAGAPIADKRWSPARKQVLRSSRIDTTTRLHEITKSQANPPKAVLSASAVGFYGDCGEALIDENTKAGSAEYFSAELCSEWEESSKRFQALCPSSIARFGVVLGRDGGAWPQLSASTRFGLSTWFGSGSQYFPWIHIDDAVHAILFLLQTTASQNDGMVNIANVVAPEFITGKAFSQVLKRQSGSLLNLPVPALVVSTMFGQMGRELFLASQKIDPGKLREFGFEFKFPTLELAIRDLLGA